jgi:hypothetical protein
MRAEKVWVPREKWFEPPRSSQSNLRKAEKRRGVDTRTIIHEKNIASSILGYLAEWLINPLEAVVLRPDSTHPGTRG